jgi:hypothetical protein
MNDFMKFGDKGSTFGMKRKAPEPKYGLTARCPVCDGFGGWHLTLNAYGKGKHFDCHCSNCNGWGHVSPEDAGHIHAYKSMEEGAANEFRAVKGLPAISYTRGNCCHNEVCTVCGSYRFIDSSD